MKIGIICLNLKVGGTSRQAIELARRLKRNNDVRIYTANKKTTYDVRDLDIRHINYESHYFTFLFFTILFRLKQILLFRYDKNERDPLLFRILQAKNFAEKMDLDIDILNPHGKFSHWISYFYKKRKNIPSVWQMNTPKKEFMYSLPINVQDQIVCLDEKTQRQAAELYDYWPKVVRSGVDIDKFIFKQRTYPHQNRILMLNSFQPRRRFEDILKIANENNWPVTIIGNITDKAYFDKIKTSFVFNHKHNLSDTQLLEEYYNHDIFAFPNDQTWGLVVFEAMATGLPVIISPDAGSSEVLEDSRTCIKEINKEGFTRMNIVYEDLSRNGRQFVENNITWDKYAYKMEREMYKLKP